MKTIEEVENDGDLIILRKEFGKNKKWVIVSAAVAFKDILSCDRWVCDEHVEEQDSLNGFIYKCEQAIAWRKTERFSYEFLNVEKLQKANDEKLCNVPGVTVTYQEAAKLIR